MRTRNVVREEVRKSVSKCKDTGSIEMLLEISELCRKAADDETFAEMSEIEKEQFFVIGDIMKCRNSRVVYQIGCILRAANK